MDIVRKTVLTEEQKLALQNEAELMSLMINSELEDNEIEDLPEIPKKTESIKEIEEIEEESIAKDLIKLRDGSYVENDGYYDYIEHRGYWVYYEDLYHIDFTNIYDDYNVIIQVLDSDGDYIDINNDYKDLIYIPNSSIIFINKKAAINQGYEFIDGIWKKKLIDVKSLSFYKELEESINQFYPNNWWLQNTAETFDLTDKSRAYMFNEVSLDKAPLVLIIKFPEINISNSNRKTHLIKDLYVGLSLNTNGTLHNGKMFGFRGILSNIEKHNHYHHSHLPGSEEYSISKFCLGSGPLVELIPKMVREYNIIDFEMFFATLSIYVAWESIEGGPHRRIENLVYKRIFTGNGYNTSQDLVKNNIEFSLRHNKVNLELYFNKTNNSFELNENLLEDSLSPSNLAWSTHDIMYKDEETNEYFTLSSNISNMYSSYNKPICTLDNKDIFCHIENITNTNTSYKSVVNPNIIKYAKKYILLRVYDYYINQIQD